MVLQDLGISTLEVCIESLRTVARALAVRIGLRKRYVFADDCMAMIMKCDVVYRDAYPQRENSVYGLL